MLCSCRVLGFGGSAFLGETVYYLHANQAYAWPESYKQIQLSIDTPPGILGCALRSVFCFQARSVPTTLAHCIMHALNVEFSSSFLYIISTVPEADEVDWFGRMQAIVQQQDAKERKRRKSVSGSVAGGGKGDVTRENSDDISSLEEAQSNAVVSLTTFVRCTEQFLIDFDEEEEDSRELKEKMVDASVKTIDVAARRYMSMVRSNEG